jgi:hypothetical protein
MTRNLHGENRARKAAKTEIMIMIYGWKRECMRKGLTGGEKCGRENFTKNVVGGE